MEEEEEEEEVVVEEELVEEKEEVVVEEEEVGRWQHTFPSAPVIHCLCNLSPFRGNPPTRDWVKAAASISQRSRRRSGGACGVRTGWRRVLSFRKSHVAPAVHWPGRHAASGPRAQSLGGGSLISSFIYK